LIKAPQPGSTQVANEIRILSRVQHPYIIPVKDMINTPTGRAVVFPFALGGDLLEWVLIEPVSELQARVIVWKMLKALEHMHALGVWHCDIKPDNILIMSSDATDVVLADFGLALLTPFRVCHHGWPGTDLYMAPEMLSGRPYTSTVDIWSLGVVFHVIVTGSMPFNFAGRDPVRVIEAKLLRLFHDRRLHILSPEGRDLLVHMLKLHSSDRMSSSDALRH
jgi:serine/threonine protein kinase